MLSNNDLDSLSFLALRLCSLKDGVASVSILVETLDYTHYRAWLYLCCPTTLCREGEKKPSEFSALFAFADGGNQTQAACVASKWAIHYFFAS